MRKTENVWVVCVTVNSGTLTITLHTLRQVLQPLLADSVEKSEHLQTNWFALVCEGGIALLTVILFVPCYGGDNITRVHSRHKLTHDDHIQLSRGQFSARCSEFLNVAQ